MDGVYVGSGGLIALAVYAIRVDNWVVGYDGFGMIVVVP
jgi:hypothetical protein